MAGLGALTVNVSDAVLPVPPFVEETALVVFAYAPTVAAVLLTVTAQVPPAASIPPLRLTLFAPATAVTEPPHEFVVADGLPFTTPSG